MTRKRGGSCVSRIIAEGLRIYGRYVLPVSSASHTTSLRKYNMSLRLVSSMIEIHAHDFGTADFVIRDGDTEYRYTLIVYEDDGGHTQIDIRKR